jgi:hypothetical protein
MQGLEVATRRYHALRLPLLSMLAKIKQQRALSAKLWHLQLSLVGRKLSVNANKRGAP